MEPAARSGEPGSDTQESVELRNVTKTFANGSIVATEKVSLTVESDEFVVLLGPSGCGKTTTLRCIAGLEIPDSGQILIGDRDVTDAEPKDRNLAFVFQSIALFPHMSVRDNMRFGLDMKTDLGDEQINARVTEAAELLGIGDFLDRSPSDLSGGQQQRVALGRAMVMEPAAFLLDEPFSALDANLRDQMQTEVKKLHRELETAMVFVTHDQEEAMSLGDKIVVMNDGKILQRGTPGEIYNEPENRFVAEFIGSPTANFVDCRVDRTDGDLVLSAGEFTLSPTERQQEALLDHIGNDVVVGVRPEYIQMEKEDALLNAEVTLIEPQGSRDVVYLEATDLELRGTTPQNEVEEDAGVAIGFSAEDIWIFGTDGRRIA